MAEQTALLVAELSALGLHQNKKTTAKMELYFRMLIGGPRCEMSLVSVTRLCSAFEKPCCNTVRFRALTDGWVPGRLG